ncbi:MAG: hypothetical protein OXG69_17695 [bacterium]|nr:hypothetical protein [bacterium]
MEDSNSSTGESEALSVLEQETLRLLRSADARAADALAALNDASRAKVLNALATEQAGGESDEPSARSSVPVGALDLRADAETSSVERSQRRVWRWVAAGALVVAGAAVAAVLLLGGEGGEDPRSPAGETKADFNNKVMMSRERNGDLYLVEPGEDVRRSALAVRDIGGTAAFGDIGRICGGRLCESLVASAGAYTFFVASDSSGDVLWAAQEDVDENEDTQFEEFMSADRITIRIVDDGVRIREERGDSQRCYVGSLDKLERVFRGDFCQVSFSDRVLGADLVDGEYETTVLSTESVLSAESETATELMVGQLEGFPQLGSYGRILISDDGESTRLISVDSGDDVWDSGDRVIRRVSSRPSGVALAVEGSTGGLELVYINESWQVETATELERGDLSFAFSETGDLFWTERPEGDTVQLFVWDDELVSGVELLSETGMAIRDVYRESVIVSVVDDFGMRLLRIAPNGESRELHELESETLREVGGRSASSVGEVVVDGEYLYASNGEKTSVVPLAGGTPVDSETWDAVRIVDTFGGMLVGLGIDDDQQVLFGIRDGLDEIIEYGDLDAAGFAQAFGEWLYVEDQEDVLVFGLETGDEIRDLSYEGYNLLPTGAMAHEDVRSLRVR